MVTKKTALLVVLVLMAVGMLGVLLILAASAAPAAPFESTVTHDIPLVSPSYVSQSQASQMLADSQTRAALVAGTKSMEPVLTLGDQVIERVPKTAGEIAVGDIITFASSAKGVTIIHRVVSIGSDDYGWFATTKGDNAPNSDAEKVRFPMVKGIVVAIVA